MTIGHQIVILIRKYPSLSKQFENYTVTQWEDYFSRLHAARNRIVFRPFFSRFLLLIPVGFECTHSCMQTVRKKGLFQWKFQNPA